MQPHPAERKHQHRGGDQRQLSGPEVKFTPNVPKMSAAPYKARPAMASP